MKRMTGNTPHSLRQAIEVLVFYFCRRWMAGPPNSIGPVATGLHGASVQIAFTNTEVLADRPP